VSGDGRTGAAHGDPRRVRVAGFDSDGTLTDRGIVWDTEGRGIRRFDVRDGIAMQWSEKAGLPVIVISGKESAALDHRLKELGVEGAQGVKDKVSCFEAFAQRHGVTLAECAFLGDDLPDVAVVRAVGYPMAVADAHPLVLGIASWISPSRGGHGAAREALEHLLIARGLWSGVLERYGAADLAVASIAGPRAFE
jgi:3-deoxy-D-manno-octulosonate 8-phosphate phosphatase (KDO 8-P phosphatase)